MWNAALRRVVRDEEEREREKRVAVQLRLKKEALMLAASIAASAAASSASVAPGAAPEGSVLSVTTEREQDGSEQARGGDTAVAGESVGVPGPPAAGGIAAEQESHEEDEEEEEEEEEEEDYIQRHLLSLPKSKWSCLEDSQQAFCLSMNRQKTVFAVGEREGRISVWDNVSIRVITRELDPTLIALPEGPESGDPKDKETGEQATTTNDSVAGKQSQAAKVNSSVDGDDAERRSGDVTPEEEEKADAEDDSATNDDGSVEADDDMEEEEDAEEEEEDDEEGEDVASVEEEGDANTEEDQDEEEEDEDEDMDEDDEDEGQENDEASLAAAQKKKRSTRRTVPTSTASAASRPDQSLESDASSAIKQHSNGLSFEDLRVVKTSLKVVTDCAWSCNTRWLFAGCEEKGNRRGRLCVWDVEAASIFATFSFDAAINCVSAHPGDPDLVLVSYYNSLPVLLNVRTCTSTRLNVPLANPTINTTVPANSRHPSLIASAKFGTTGAWIYCATSKSTLAMFETATLACLDSVTLPVLIQFIDLAIDYRETALLLTSSKGIHEFAIRKPDDSVEIGGDGDNEPQQQRSLFETRAYATGAVRAPWALCCFSDDESFVVGMPVVRHRHVGENGLYTWNRATGRVQHNPGVKDGVNSLAWDTRRDSILAVSTTGAIFVLEEEFKTTWSGPMYPAGYRLITDNELHVAAMDAELEAIAKAKREPIATTGEQDEEVLDIFTIEEPRIGPPSAQKQPMAHLEVRLEPQVKGELVYIPSIPIAHHHKKHHHAFQGGHSYNEEKHFGLGQSIFEPLKVPAKAKSNSRPKKKAESSSKENGDGAETATAKKPSAPKKKRARSSIGSQKRRRR